MNLAEMRKGYLEVRQALPWLDAWHSVGEKPFETSHGATLPSVDLPVLGSCAIPDPNGKPVIMRAQDYTPEKAEEMLKAQPNQAFIYATSDRKLIYDRRELRRLAADYDNFYICTANLTPCLMILEEFYGLGLTGKLVYGSGLPLFSEDASLGPIVLGTLPWSIKCDIAGNTLRRLLGQPEVNVPEPDVCFSGNMIIDTHMHFSLYPLTGRVLQPAFFWRWPEWRGYMEANFTAVGISTPSELLHKTWTEPPKNLLDDILSMVRSSNGRFRFYAAFNPLQEEVDRALVEQLLPLPECMGIKIHPASHQVTAEDDRYDFAFAAAQKAGKVVLTHSWEDSSYNPVQKLTLPHLFEKHLKKHPGVKFILGHSGGRPSTMNEVIRICNSYENVYVDLSGDYFHDGMVETLAGGIGAEKILFGTDAYWFNSHTMLGILFASKLTDAQLELITHGNAEKLYGIVPGCH